MKTLADLCGERTKIIMCYEGRTTGNKPEIERKFFKVRSVKPFTYLNGVYMSLNRSDGFIEY